VHAIEHLLQLRERAITLLLRGAPELYLDNRAEDKQLGVLFLDSLARGQ
jgi:hypothetical protein